MVNDASDDKSNPRHASPAKPESKRYSRLAIVGLVLSLAAGIFTLFVMPSLDRHGDLACCLPLGPFLTLAINLAVHGRLHERHLEGSGCTISGIVISILALLVAVLLGWFLHGMAHIA